MKFRFVLSISALAVVACGEEEEAPVTELEPVCAYFSVLRPRNDEVIALPDLCPPPDPPSAAGGAGAEDPSDPVPSELLSVVLGSDRMLGVDVTAEAWTFRPPHACGDAAQCGYVVVELDPGIEVADGTPIATRLARAESAINSLVLDLPKAPQDIDGYHTLQATLMNADRTPFFGHLPITYTFVLTTEDGEDPEEPDGLAGGAGGEAPR